MNDTPRPKLRFEEWAHRDLRERPDYQGLMSDAEALLKTMGCLPDDPVEALREKETAALMAVAVMEPGEFRRLVPHPVLAALLEARMNNRPESSQPPPLDGEGPLP
jgi:hypothetical protein